jgi:predicted nucleotidyltransferase
MVLKVYDEDDTEHLINIVEVVDEHSVRVDEDLLGDKIFVYGQQVDDFVFLKKDAIWTVATSALQEVDRQLQAEKARNDALEARISALEKN